jgi:branched-chain amino acid transport system permease protein
VTTPVAPEVPEVEVDVPPAPLGGQPAPTGRSTARRILTSLAAAVGAVIALILVFRFIGEAVDLVDGLVNDPTKASTVDLFTQAIYIGIAATGLNILTGYNGQVSLGHGAFFGVGAYTSAILMFDHDWSFLPTLPVSMAICFVSGAVIGFPALRVKGLYLALVTLGLAVLFPDLTDKFVNGTGGTNLISLRGEQLDPPDWYFWFPDWIADTLDSYVGARDQWAFFLTLTIAIVLLACVWLISRSRFGRALIAVRDQESAAETVGINLPRVKVTAFALSALYAGTAGSLSILVTRTANAGKVETFQLSIEFLVALVIGGAATVFGPMLGAFIVVFFRDFIDDQDRLSDLLDDPSRAKLLSPAIFGVGLIILMYVLPDGIVGGSRRLIRRLRRR